MNMGIIGRSIPIPNLANLEVTNIPITMIQRRFINLERLSTSSFSSDDFSCVWVLYGMVICGSITHCSPEALTPLLTGPLAGLAFL